MKSDVVPGQNWKGGDFPDLREMYRQPKSAMIGLTRGSKQSRYSDVIGVLCFGCDKMTSQPSALFMTCSIQNSFSAKL